MSSPDPGLSVQDVVVDLDEEIDLVELQLGTQNSVHDRTQFESKFDFELPEPGQGEKSYAVDLYFYTPKSMGITAESYPREAFYRDLTHLVRIRTPEFKRPRGDFVTPKLASVDEVFKYHLNAEQRGRLIELVVHDIKMFGCLVYTEMKRVQADVSRVVARAQQTRNPGLLKHFEGRWVGRVEAVHRAIRKYRMDYVWRTHNEPLVVDSEVRRALSLVDEYLSYRLESWLIGLHRNLESGAPPCEDLLNQIEALLEGEMAYRDDQLVGFANRPSARLENHYYRLGLLKKYVSEVLFLQAERLNKDYVYRNAIAAFGAALAAAFAILINFQTAKMVLEGQDFGVRILLITLVGVICYVFKDRIKDLTKEYFNSRLKAWMPDFESQVYFPHFDSEGRAERVHLAHSREVVRYYQERTSIPPDIDYIREIGHREEPEPDRQENVLHYNKNLSLDLKAEVKEHFGRSQVRRIHDVLRFDISHFLAKLGDPEKKLSYFQPQQGIVTTRAPRVYHLNLVFRYRVTQWHQGSICAQVTDYERLRLVINKNGILRVETVISRGELGQETYREIGQGELPPLILPPVRRGGGQ